MQVDLRESWQIGEVEIPARLVLAPMAGVSVQIFGAEPGVMAEAARMVEDAGADIVDINFGCPVRKVTKTGAGAHCLEEPARACAIVEAVANAISLPLSVKMRRGLPNGSRICLEVGPQLVDAGA